jgi:hypothetical protein
MKCKTKDCELEAYILSFHDEVKNRDKLGLPLNYNRTIRWRCDDGHRFDTKKVVPHFEPEPKTKTDYSGKRFHRLGFTGHRVNPPSKPKEFFPVEMTNHDKMIWRKDQRGAKAAK